MLGGMFGNTFNIGAPVVMFFFGRDAVRYAVFNDMLMTMPADLELGVWIATRLGSHEKRVSYPSVWRSWWRCLRCGRSPSAVVLQALDLSLRAAREAAHMIGQATIPVTLFVLGMTIPWRNLTGLARKF